MALLPGTDAAGAARVAERLRVAVQTLALPHAYSSAAEVVTLSLGVAVLPANATAKGDTGDVQTVIKDLLAQADTALYAAKQAGRNRYRLAGELA